MKLSLNKKDNTIKAFYALVRAGLWEQSVRLSPYAPIDFETLYQLAEDQSVVGLIAAGLEHIEDMKTTKQQTLPFLKKVISMETRNSAMNYFIGVMVDKMREEGIYSLLVKGQGVAQCYSRPQWRSAGDVDFFYDAENYEKAKAFLMPLASSVNPEEKCNKHQAMIIKPWIVELHGLMPTEISERINDGVAEVQRDIFERGGIRIWHNDGVDVPLPNPDNDVIIIFTHFLQHFFVGGVGLRQISDWCRLIWTYREGIDRGLLENRLRTMGIMSEWRAFAKYVVSYLGMPLDAMPFYSSSACLERKSRRICNLILYTGNFGHNQDQSYRRKYPKLIEKSITFFRRLGEFIRLSLIFPLDAPRFFLTYVTRRTKAVL